MNKDIPYKVCWYIIEGVSKQADVCGESVVEWKYETA
jgi:hypothetical protein